MEGLNSKKTLIYAGASIDNILKIDVFERYGRFILFDLLPNNCYHYKQHEKDHEYMNNEEKFFGKLKEMYGDFIVDGLDKNKLYFPKHNITYFINTNVDDILDLEEGDIYIVII